MYLTGVRFIGTPDTETLMWKKIHFSPKRVFANSGEEKKGGKGEKKRGKKKREREEGLLLLLS